LYNYLKNPYSHLEQIHRVSRYLTNKHGVIKDILRSLKSMPTLNYHLAWSSFDEPEKIKKHDKKIDDLLDELNIKKLIRDGIFEVAELGTVAMTNRKNKYIQFLELDELRIQSQRNGKWIVEYDLMNIKTKVKMNIYNNHMIAMQSLPDEVNPTSFNLYMNKGEDYRYVELKDADVINLDANRNYPFGLPYSFGAWMPLLQKEIINRVERSVSDRLIKSVVILTAGNIGGKEGKPAPKELIEHYFNQVKDLMIKKDNNGHNMTNGETNGTGVVAIPDFFDLKTLEVDTTMFTKDLYNKIDNDIFMNLGVSSSLIYGGGNSNFSSAQINNEKFQRYIHTIIEQFEHIINGYIKNILPKSVSCKIKFKKPVFAEDKQVEMAHKIYQTTGAARPWIELSTGMTMEEFISMARYEREVLQTEKYLYPPLNPFTTSGNDGAGRPEVENPTENTDRSKSSNGNSLPSPSD